MTKRDLVFATNNQHKVAEVQSKVNGNFNIISLTDIGCTEDIVEDGTTLEENASIKSKYVYNNYQKDCFGDDTGLEIEYLNNEPGVYSARYAGGRDPEKNIELVLEKLKGESNRKARFRTVISLIIDGKEHLFEGIVNGTITEGKSGSEGFGYDPIFKPDGYDITFAEMSMEQKNQISHRGRAMEKLLEFLTGM
ncbi:non-canonical purine NTP pyrophosphatase, rdgB/HAM1 family [Pseudopedobacter saltans DSM 12145]|uniref:dITP/XTP pyrophosphatase n=1 Tax=Pseudopedobacter saltans (strain ATCC 51119 / DSM 12145 / JCM 21818 / CCUG 39354 / LMG 10337 / NBRC 100064 / NCIMB 13643) TaxID=762903 RepID=F0SDI9_PSESL|nr:non-canonical purine NTP diphosphatase [Pseudopedobacter saltans]ADY53972.1 non-canonical purine NTP pyrophosphatase, rdgB/HAM1 family [Pseudopedobacter saltans DSM 12145]